MNAALQKAYDAGYYGEWYEEAVELAKSETAMDLTIEDDASNG